MPENTFQLMIRIFTFYKKISQIHPIEEIETKHDAYNLIAQKGVFNLEPQEQETALNKIAQQIIHLCSQKTKQEPITQEEVINIIERGNNQRLRKSVV